MSNKIKKTRLKKLCIFAIIGALSIGILASCIKYYNAQLTSESVINAWIGLENPPFTVGTPYAERPMIYTNISGDAVEICEQFTYHLDGKAITAPVGTTEFASNSNYYDNPVSGVPGNIIIDAYCPAIPAGESRVLNVSTSYTLANGDKYQGFISAVIQR
jgi:hypothetical protein